ncbi:PepSY domain-containing protein, partial [Erwinia amylovora]|nr:PepSY domain-containing protein [Erwinia amylovora]
MDEHAEHQGHSQIMHDCVRIFPYQFDAVLHAARAAGIDAAKLEIRPDYRADRAWTVSETDHRWPTQL